MIHPNFLHCVSPRSCCFEIPKYLPKYLFNFSTNKSWGTPAQHPTPATHVLGSFRNPNSSKINPQFSILEVKFLHLFNLSRIPISNYPLAKQQENPPVSKNVQFSTAFPILFLGYNAPPAPWCPWVPLATVQRLPPSAPPWPWCPHDSGALPPTGTMPSLERWYDLTMTCWSKLGDLCQFVRSLSKNAGCHHQIKFGVLVDQENWGYCEMFI